MDPGLEKEVTPRLAGLGPALEEGGPGIGGFVWMAKLTVQQKEREVLAHDHIGQTVESQD